MENLPFTDDELETIAHKCGITPSSAFFASVRNAARAYLTDKEIGPMPRPSQVRKKLDRLRRQLERVNTELMQVDPESRFQFQLCWPQRGGVFNQTQKHVEDLSSMLEVFLRQPPPDPGGPPTDEALKLYMQHLARIYERETGKKAGISRKREDNQFTGPFFRFVQACLNPFNPGLSSKRSNQALGQAVRRVLNDMRKTP